MQETIQQAQYHGFPTISAYGGGRRTMQTASMLKLWKTGKSNLLLKVFAVKF